MAVAFHVLKDSASTPQRGACEQRRGLRRKEQRSVEAESEFAPTAGGIAAANRNGLRWERKVTQVPH
jgi:hypothetical protein